MTALILATIALALAILGLILAWKHYNDLTEYLDSLNVAQEDDAARANRLFLDFQQTKERINEDLVAHNKRIVNLHGRVTKFELQKDQPS